MHINIISKANFFSSSTIFHTRSKISKISPKLRITYVSNIKSIPLSSHPRYLINSILRRGVLPENIPLWRNDQSPCSETVSQCRGTNFRNYRDARNLIGGHVNRKDRSRDWCQGGWKTRGRLRGKRACLINIVWAPGDWRLEYTRANRQVDEISRSWLKRFAGAPFQPLRSSTSTS